MPMPKVRFFTLMGLITLSSGCAVPIKDFRYCSPVPGNLGAVCDNFLTDNQTILDQSQWLALQAEWIAAGQAIECTQSQTVGDLKKELEKLCSVTTCAYEVEQQVKQIVSSLEKIETTSQKSFTLK